MSRAATHAPDSRSIAVCIAPRITVSSSNATTIPELKAIAEDAREIQRGRCEARGDDAQVRRQQKSGADCGRGDADRTPCAAHLEKSAPGQPVAKIARAGEIQVPAQPEELGDQHQHRDPAGDPMKCPTGESGGQFIGRKAQQRANHASEHDGGDEPCESAHWERP